MQRTLKGVVAAIMATILALAGVTAAQAQDAQSTHLAYTRYLKSTNGNVVAAFSAFPGNDYRTAQIPNSQEQIVYCFNMPKAPPYELSWVTGPKTTSGQWPKWDRAYGELHQYAGSPRAASIDANVLKVIYNGYDGGNDRAGIQQKYNLSDAEFREATQQAVWYYTDRFGFSTAYGPNIVAAAKALAGLDQSTQLKNPPSKSTLEIFKANNSSFQNLLGVKFVDEETGEPVDDDCGCEYPKVDIVRNEDGSVTIITQSGPGEENIKKETISAPKVTLTDVINTEGRNGVKIEVVNPDGSKDSKTVWGGLDGKDGKDGVDGKDGKDGVDGKSVTAITERGENEGKTGSWIRTYIVEANGKLGRLISETFVEDGQDGENGAPGKDGKSVTAITERGENEGKTGSWIRTYIVEADGSRGDLISETFVEDGQDGQDGTDGKDGVDGKDGQSVTAITERGEQDGKTGSWIRTYIVETDGSRGELISETFVEDGQDGAPGKDGKSVTAITERGEQDGKTGSWIRTYIVEADGSRGELISETFVEDGQNGTDGKDGQDGKDGLSVTAITERGENEGKTGSWIRTYIVEADGSRGELISETFVEDGQNGTDGKDGLSVTAITERGENEGKTGSWIRTYIVEADGSRGELISETFVEDGQDGTDGVDGKSVTAITERGEQGGQTGSWIRTYIVEADGSLGDPISVTFVKDGKDGKDGQDGQTPDVPETDQGNVIETENGKVEVERGEDGKVIIITRDGKNDETNRIEFPKGWDTEHGKINNITTERNKDGKLILHVVFEDGTKESYDVEKGTKVEVNKNVNLNSSVGSTDNDTLNRCLANAAESPLVWLIPIGVLAGVGGPLLQPYMGVFQEQIDKINADLSGQFQFNRDRDPFGIGGRGADNQNSQWGEFQARINDANRQFQEALGGPQAQQAGQVAVALIGVIAAGSAIYKWCTTEPTASADATETAKLSS